jgi:hypothetical protein
VGRREKGEGRREKGEERRAIGRRKRRETESADARCMCADNQIIRQIYRYTLEHRKPKKTKETHRNSQTHTENHESHRKTGEHRWEQERELADICTQHTLV